MIGKGIDKEYQDLCRLYLLLHSDHEGANVSAHATHLVATALADVYYACSAGMDGLAGPLHGVANQECLHWLLNLRKEFGGIPTPKQFEDYAWKELKAGKVIPGYGHAVLRITDPRFTALYNFAEKHFPNYELFNLVKLVYDVLPGVLGQFGKVKNPWPNVDAINGTTQYYYGIKGFDFYTVLFGVSRILGLTAHVVWARALGKPIERPKSLTTYMLEQMVVQGNQ
jgi:citrate synthase